MKYHKYRVDSVFLYVWHNGDKIKNRKIQYTLENTTAFSIAYCAEEGETIDISTIIV